MTMLNSRENSILSWHMSQIFQFSFWVLGRIAFSHPFEFRHSHVKVAKKIRAEVMSVTSGQL